MPLREDLLAPIAGENPAGRDLYYDQVFLDIKEARREDDDSLPEGSMVLAQKKKADHRAVIKLAGEALAKKSKDLRLIGWLAESHLRTEGFPVLRPSIELLRAMQETFWSGVYPLIEEGGDLELRKMAVETAANLISGAVRKLPLTRSGLNFEDYLESRTVGYEKDATSDAKLEARKYEIDHGKLTAEDFDQAFSGSPKSLYADAVASLAESLEATGSLDAYGKEAYGDDAPNLVRLRETLEEVHRAAESLLNERRKTEPDPVPVAEVPVSEAGRETSGSEITADEHQEPSGQTPLRRTAGGGPPARIAEAYEQVVESAEFLFDKDPGSPVPYLVCAGLRLGETRMQGESPAPGFAVGPSSEVRHSLRGLANKGAWKELLRASLPILASECARAWLDLHRYVWRAGRETGAEAISEAVAGTVKSLLSVRPELRYWTLEDDTGAANPETQQWLDSIVLHS
jgi:type VI secretion system ImpA family protein